MGEITIREVGRPGDLGWILMSHGELYTAEYGWTIEPVTARIVADYAEHARRGRDAGWIAELDGTRVGSVLCVHEDERTARLRLLLVDPAARGHGIGRRLVATCIEFAGGAGYHRLVLWTNEPLAAARRIYLDAGFTLVAEARHTEFGREELGQSYALAL